jgi:hypothetical protein
VVTISSAVDSSFLADPFDGKEITLTPTDQGDSFRDPADLVLPGAFLHED